MQTIQQAVNKIKNAAARQAIVEELTHFHAYRGRLHATNGRLAASTPFPSDLSFAVKAPFFQELIRNLEQGEIKLAKRRFRGSANDSTHLEVTCNRFAAMLPQNDQVLSVPEPSGKRIAVSRDFASKLELMRPFVSDNATQQWAMCYWLHNKKIVATSNAVLAMVECADLPDDIDVMLPSWAADFALGVDAKLASLVFDEVSCSFEFAEGTWVRSATVPAKFPNIEPVIERAGKPTTKVSSELRQLFDTLYPMCELKCRIEPTKIVADDEHTEIEVETGMPEGKTSWFSAEHLAKVLHVAEMWTPYNETGACAWAGQGITGAIARMR